MATGKGGRGGGAVVKLEVKYENGGFSKNFFRSHVKLGFSRRTFLEVKSMSSWKKSGHGSNPNERENLTAFSKNTAKIAKIFAHALRAHVRSIQFESFD